MKGGVVVAIGKSNFTYIEKHIDLSINEYEGLWRILIMHPTNPDTYISAYLQTTNSDFDLDKYGDSVIIEAGERFKKVLDYIVNQIESYPFSWELAGQKIVPHGYDFECTLSNGKLNSIDLTEIAYQIVCEHYNIFSPNNGSEIVDESDSVSGKGVMTKLKITLDRPKYVNHLAIDFFTEYPIEILSFMYQIEEGDSQPFHELSLSNVVYTNSSLYLHFPRIYAKVFYVILKQETYTLINQMDDQNLKLQKEEWENASTNSRNIYIQEACNYLSQAAITLGEQMLEGLKNTAAIRNIERTYSENDAKNYREQFRKIKQKIDFN